MAAAMVQDSQYDLQAVSNVEHMANMYKRSRKNRLEVRGKTSSDLLRYCDAALQDIAEQEA